jgi:LuxR family maltose regulon positive regulatory protein
VSASTSEAVPQGFAILRTKLNPPPARRELVQRADLVARLVGSDARLILVSAPPGFGKSTLLAQWSSAKGATRGFAWVSLERGDNDPVRFWSYVLRALEPYDADLADLLQRFLNAPGNAFSELLLPALVDALEAMSRPAVLVLDDYHVISNGDIHEGMGMLVDHLPATLQLTLATRSDPALPLGKLRARAELLEIRAADLRFDTGESEILLNDLLGLGLSPEHVSRLQRRTEGWAAGLYLAALSLHGRTEAAALVDTFAGSDRHIVDYLVGEVLENQRDEVRMFLLRTSILGRFTAPLCDDVLERADSGAILREIEASNLFLVPLDRTRSWYRYHHLFGELLRHELEQREPDAPVRLHRRASAWHAEHGTAREAIDHALASGDSSWAADLLAQHWNAFQNLGRLQTVEKWLDALPEDVVRDDARLCLARCGNFLTLGRRDQVEAWATAAEQAAVPAGPRVGAASIEAEANTYRAVGRYMLGRFSAALEAATRAVELERDDTSPWRSMACAALGRTLFWCGQRGQASERLEEAVRFSQPGANSLSVTGALGYLAVIRAQEGETEEAVRHAEAAIELSSDNGFGEHFVTTVAHIGRSLALARADALEDADAAAARAVELSERGAGPVERAFALVVRSAARRALGDTSGAGSLSEAAADWAARVAEPGLLSELVGAAERRPRRHGVVDRDELSDRELAVLRLFPTDLTLREIGSQLFISYNTVKTHARSVYRKLGVSSREEAVTAARAGGML